MYVLCLESTLKIKIYSFVHQVFSNSSTGNLCLPRKKDWVYRVRSMTSSQNEKINMAIPVTRITISGYLKVCISSWAIQLQEMGHKA